MGKNRAKWVRCCVLKWTLQKSHAKIKKFKAGNGGGKRGVIMYWMERAPVLLQMIMTDTVKGRQTNAMGHPGPTEGSGRDRGEGTELKD